MIVIFLKYYFNLKLIVHSVMFQTCTFISFLDCLWSMSPNTKKYYPFLLEYTAQCSCYKLSLYNKDFLLLLKVYCLELYVYKQHLFGLFVYRPNFFFQINLSCKKLPRYASCRNLLTVSKASMYDCSATVSKSSIYDCFATCFTTMCKL